MVSTARVTLQSLKIRLELSLKAFTLGICGLIFINTISGCVNKVPHEPITQKSLSGSWYGQQINDDEQLIWVNKRNADGSFKLTFKKCFNEKELFYQEKIGVWTYKNTTYATTTTKLSDHTQTWQPATPNRQYIEKYTIEKLSDNILYYRNEEGDFKAYHVDDNYALQCGQSPIGLDIN